MATEGKHGPTRTAHNSLVFRFRRESVVNRAMQGNRSRNTRPESAIRSALHRRGLRFRVNTRPLVGTNRSADLVFRRARVAVFVDGCFWHSCPQHCRKPTRNIDYWGPKLERNQTRDREADMALQAAGWSVVRIWEHEPVESAVERVKAIVTGSSVSTAKDSVSARERSKNRQPEVVKCS